MVDYTKATGSSGTMMIRDTGTIVEFWIKAGSSTYAYDMPWAYVVNGVSSNWLEFRFESGGLYQKVGGWNVTYDQTVTFKLGSTGTSGLGGPTTFSVAIQRATEPDKPGPFTITGKTGTSITGDAYDNGNGGSAILQRRIGYGTSPSNVQAYLDTNSAGTATVTGLANGTTYYFWYQVRNAVGWSPFSNRTSATTWTVPPAPTAPVLSEITQLSLKAVFHSNGTGGTPAVLEWQLGYGTSPTTVQTYLTSTGTSVVTNLAPGTQYYFWARGRNEVGWGPWSARATATMIAGAHVKVGDTWKKAVPYVNVNGVWKVARPYSRAAGVWKITT